MKKKHLQLKELEKEKKYPIVYDEDSPELTPETEKAFLLAAVSRNKNTKREMRDES